MAGLSISGLGSGLDTAALVASLMQAERIPQTRLRQLQDGASRQITAWNELRTRMATVQGAAEALASPAKALGSSGRSSNAEAVKVSAGEGAETLQARLTVEKLATAEQRKVTGLSPGMTVGAGTTQLVSGLPGTGVGAVRFTDEATAGVHSIVVSRASSPASANGALRTALSATDLTLQLGDGPASTLTLSTSYASDSAMAEDVNSKLAGTGLQARAVGGRLEIRSAAEGPGQRFTLGGGAAAELGLPTTERTGAAAVVTVDGTRTEVDPADGPVLDLGGGISLELSGPLRTGTISSNLVRTTAATTLGEFQQMLGAAGSPLTATTLLDGDSATLVLTSRSTGTAGAAVVQSSDHAMFATPPTLLTPAGDAVLRLGGEQVTRSSNRITDLLPGVTLDLLRVTTDPVDVEVQRDSSATSTKAKALVDAMNALVTSVGTLTKYDVATKSGAALAGDSTARSLASGLFSKVGTATGSGTLRGLSQLGIETTRDGQFVLKGEVLTKALESAPEDVAAVLAGLGTSIAAHAKELARTGGTLTQRKDGAQTEVANRQKQIDAMETRLTATEARYRKQYAALESAMGQLNLQKSSLAAALSGISG